MHTPALWVDYMCNKSNTYVQKVLRNPPPMGPKKTALRIAKRCGLLPIKASRVGATKSRP